MRSTEALLENLRSGARLGWFGFTRLAVSRDPRLLEILFEALDRATTVGETCLHVGRLAKLSAYPFWLEALRQRPDLDLLGQALGTIDARLDPMTQVFEAAAVVQGLGCFRQLFERLGPALLEPARRLLEGPPQGAIASWQGDSPVFVLEGPKLPAVATVSAHGDASDTCRLAAVAANPEEDAWTRVDAAVAWHHFAGDQVAPKLVEYCLDPRLLDGELFGKYAVRLAAAGGSLVPLLLPYLDHVDYRLRARAREILVAIGEPAKEPLANLLRTTDQWRVEENAADALQRLDRALLRQARRDREADGRSISLARPLNDAERGLSQAKES
ncbi:MAG: hypothetical protein HUU35_15485 [Armatimonadetes bacterium]|nr:hypothetical protein [Armatimonadota bacterium]